MLSATYAVIVQNFQAIYCTDVNKFANFCNSINIKNTGSMTNHVSRNKFFKEYNQDYACDPYPLKICMSTIPCYTAQNFY